MSSQPKKKKTLVDRITELPIIEQLVSWSQERSLPGFDGIPIYDVVVFFLREAQRFALSIRANAIAFSFFISLFPALIVLITLLGYLPPSYGYLEGIKANIDSLLPGTAGDQINNIIDEVRKPRGGLLSLGFVLAIYFSSNGMLAMMQSFEKSYDKTFKNRNVLNQRLIAIALTALLGVLVLASVVLVILGNTILAWIGQYIPLSAWDKFSIAGLRWLVIVGLFYSGIALVYRYGPATYRPIPFFSPGASLATLFSLLTSLAFSFYVDNFQTYSKLYGSIGAIIVILLWIQFNALILLIGFELNAAIAVNRDLLAEESEEDEEAF